MSPFRWLAAVGCAVAVLLSASPPVAAAPTATTIAIGQAAPDSLDPALTSTQAGWDIVNQMFSGLTRWDRRAETLTLDLAASDSASPDFKTWTFTLSSRAHWSDGKPITAADEVFAIQRALDPATGPDRGYRSFLAGLVTGVSATGRSTVQFQLSRPASFFPAVVSMPITRPVPQAVVTRFGSAWLDPANIVVSGAYTLASTSPNQTVLVASKKARPHPAIDLITYDTGDPSQFGAAFKAGILDYADVFVMGGPVTVGLDPGLAPYLAEPGNQPLTERLIFNTAYGNVTNADVRRALSAATDRAGMSSAVNGAGSWAATAETAPGIPGSVAGTPGIGIGYDPAAAHGYRDSAGSAFPSSVTINYPCSQRRQQEANFLQSNWESVFGSGFTVKTECGPAGRVIGGLTNPDPTAQADVTIIAWAADYPDAYNFLWDDISDRYRWHDPSFDAALADSATTSDATQRQSDFTTAEKVLVRTVVGAAPLYYRPDAFLKQTRLSVIGSYLENWSAI